MLVERRIGRGLVGGLVFLLFAGLIMAADPVLAQSVYAVPASISADGSRAVEGEIMAFLATVPDGSTVRFASSGVYGQSGSIVVADRKNVELDGNGSTFQMLVPNDPTQPRPNWRIAGGDGVTLRNMRIKGTYSPPPRGTPGQGTHFDHGISLWGPANAQIRDVDVSNVDGDFVACDPDVRGGADFPSSPPCRNVVVDGLHGHTPDAKACRRPRPTGSSCGTRPSPTFSSMRSTSRSTSGASGC